MSKKKGSIPLTPKGRAIIVRPGDGRTPARLDLSVLDFAYQCLVSSAFIAGPHEEKLQFGRDDRYRDELYRQGVYGCLEIILKQVEHLLDRFQINAITGASCNHEIAVLPSLRKQRQEFKDFLATPDGVIEAAKLQYSSGEDAYERAVAYLNGDDDNEK